MTISQTYLRAASIYALESRKRYVACVPFGNLSSDAQGRWLRIAEQQQDRFSVPSRSQGPRVTR